MPSRRERANAIRALSMDAVQKANSGHPGAPMGMADIAEVLWRDYLKHNPANPMFADRDRFILSNGHGSMLIYSLLHLTGYDLSIDDLKNFRQLHSRTPGHPEYGYTPGVETTTGPLGQGFANAVGFAVAEKTLAAQFNRPGHNIVNHHTYVFMGDGCMMEGISHEVASLAGTLRLNKLVAFYDDNGISIDGEVEGWFTDDTPKRFESYGWLVIRNVDGHDADEIKTAIDTAHKSDKPTLICCKTTIGFGSPNKQGKEDCHGAPLGTEEIALTRAALKWTHGPFEIPADIYSEWNAKEKGLAAEAEWDQRFAAYSAAFPTEANELIRRMSGELPADFAEKSAAYVAEVNAKGETIASRKASQNALSAFGPLLPEFLGGSADLAGSNLTIWKGCRSITGEDATGNYLHYGVREFGMGAIMNGIALHGGFVPYGATFLIFMCGFIGELFGGWVADKWKAAGGQPSTVMRSMFAGSAAIAALCILAVAYTSDAVAVISLLCVALFFIRWCGMYWCLPAILGGQSKAGVLGGSMNFCGNMVGVIVPILIGLIVQYTGSYFLALIFFVVMASGLMLFSSLIDYRERGLA